MIQLTTTTRPGANYIGKAAAKQKAIEFINDMDSPSTIGYKSVDIVTINGVPLYRIQIYDQYITVYTESQRENKAKSRIFCRY